MKKLNLTEATALALEGKLVETSEVEKYKSWLDDIKNDYYKLDRNSSMYRYNYNELLKTEKEYLRKWKRAISEERGEYVSPAKLTNVIKKLGDMEKYTDQTTSVRGFHWYGKGDFEVNTDTYNNTINENDLYYDVYFYGNNSKEKAERIYNLLKENGYNVEINGSHLTVLSYK